MKLRLSDYDKIIFDMDGVITSEMAYWYTAAATCYDLLFNYKHYGNSGIDYEWCRRQIDEIYNTIFCGGRTVKAVKKLGVNTNWDLTYIVFCVSKYLDPELERLDFAHFQSVCMFIENIELQPPKLYDVLSELVSEQTGKNADCFKRDGDFFRIELYNTFDMWYHGNNEFEGIKVGEKLLFDADEIKAVLQKLADNNLKIGIGTGRPRNEIEYPMTQYGLNDYFDKDMYVTYDEVCEAEEELKSKNPLAKPDPFVFLKAALGKNHSNKELCDGEYTYDELSRVLVVGDAPSDLIAAKKAGFDFLGVLTGVDRNGAEKYFKENNADFIFDDILEFMKL